MLIKLNTTKPQPKQLNGRSVVGKKTLNTMILTNIDNYKPRSEGRGYSAAVLEELQPFDAWQLENGLNEGGLTSYDACEAFPQAQEAPETAQSTEFETTVDNGWNFEPQAEEIPFVIENSEVAQYEEPAVEFDYEDETTEAALPAMEEIEALPIEEFEPQFEEVCEAEQAPQMERPYSVTMEDLMAPLLQSDDHVMRTQRGTIAFVKHDAGTFLMPIYNKCGILDRIDLNGVELCRRNGRTWNMLDTEGREVKDSGFKSVYFDRKGNLITWSVEGTKMVINVEGAVCNS